MPTKRPKYEDPSDRRYREACERSGSESLTSIQHRTDLDRASAQKVQDRQRGGASVFLVVYNWNEIIHSAWSTEERARAQIAKLDKPERWDVVEMEIDPKSGRGI